MRLNTPTRPDAPRHTAAPRWRIAAAALLLLGTAAQARIADFHRQHLDPH